MLPDGLYALDFTPGHYRILLQKLFVDHSEELFNDKKGAIDKGLSEYFSRTFQTIHTELSVGSCSITKQFVDPGRSEAFDRMVHQKTLSLIELLRRKSEFLPLPYLLSLPENIRIGLVQGFIDMGEPMETARHILRQQVNAVFALDEKDIIFFLRGRISVRYFTAPKKFTSGIDKRFGGESLESMEEMYRNCFPEGAWGEIEPILGEVIEEKLNFTLIDNATFSRTFIPVFRSMVEILLLEILSAEEREKIEGFTGYVLRQNFHPILLFTAKKLLECVENRDKNAETFIKYFTEDIVIDGSGNKIQKYAIVDAKQQRWNYSSILSIMIQYKQSKLKISAQKEAIAAAQERLGECEEEIALENNNRLAIMERIAELKTNISEIDIRTVQLKKQPAQKPDEALSLKAELGRLNTYQHELHDRKKGEISKLELVNSRISNKKQELIRRQKKLSHEKKALQHMAEQTATLMETYEMVVEALATVLAKR